MLGTRPLSVFPLSTLPEEFESDTAIITVRYATHSFVTRSTDSPADTFIPGRINRGLTISRRLRQGPDGQFGSILETSFGEIELNNADGQLDPLSNDYFADGRIVRLKIGAKEVVGATRITPQYIASAETSSSGAAANAFSVSYPADGVVEGDFFVAELTINDRGSPTGGLSSTPTGWTLVAESTNGACYQAILYRFADGDEAGTTQEFDWESSDDTNDCIVGRILQFRYVDPDDPIDGLTAQTNGNLSTISMPSVTTLVENSLAVAILSATDNASFASPSGETGGVWSFFGPTDSATSTGDDAATRRVSARIATPGTISGGSIAITPSGSPESMESVIRGFALRGLPIAAGHERVQAFSSFATVYQTVAGPWSHEHDALRLRIQDLGSKLQDRLQLLTYSGVGGENGTSDLSGRTRPVGFGRCPNVTLQLVDPATFVFQASSESIFSVDAVYDRGVELTFDQDFATFALLSAATVGSGEYATCLADGYVKVGGGADPGSITADIHFDQSATHSSTIRRMVVDFSPITVSEIDQGSFDTFATDQPAEMGIFFAAGDQSTVEEAVEAVAFSGGAFAGQDGSGLYRVQRIEVPDLVADWSFDERNIIFDGSRRIERREPPYGVPWKAWGVGYGRNWTVQHAADVAAGVTTARKLFLESEYRFIYSQSAEVAIAHATSRGVIRRSLFTGSDDAADESARLTELYSLGRVMYEVPVAGVLFQVKVGQTVRLTYPRWDLVQGKNFVVLGVDDDADVGLTALRVFG